MLFHQGKMKFYFPLYYPHTCCSVLCWFYKPHLVFCWCPETETSSIYWTQLSRFHLKMEIEYSLRNVIKRQDDGQCTDVDSYINIPSSQTCRQH
jgi:hypothetical protein